jgi:serine/threonine-protein kinase
MPFVRGESLRARIDKGPVSVDESIGILRDVARALAYAHRQGIVHRDIKPENILLSEDTAVVTDFGIAKALQAARTEATGGTLTQTGTSLGSPRYMAPEQAAADPATDQRADIYAWGVVAYELLSGKHPFADKTSPQQMLAAHMGITPREIGSTAPRIPLSIADLITRSLSKDPAQRPASGTELLAALNELAAHSSGGRRRIAILSGALAALLLIALGAWRYAATRAPAAGDSRKMLAVLPFENLGQPEDQFFADGVTEELTSRLASLHELGVISRTSSNQYRKTTKSLKQIGQELGVQYVLEGSVRWEKAASGPGRIRVTPQLIRVSDDSHVWSERYDAAALDIFSVQGDVAEKVTRALDVRFGGGEQAQLTVKPTANFDAYAAYLRAQQFAEQGFEPAMLDSAIALDEKAIALDPKFALAYASVARVRGSQHFADQKPSRLTDMKSAIQSALRLDPGLPEAHLALGNYYLATFDHDHAAAEYEWLATKRPNDPTVMHRLAAIDGRRGHYAKGLARQLKAVELDPRSSSAALGPMLPYYHLGDYAGAMRAVQRSLALEPGSLEGQERKAQAQFEIGGDLEGARVTLRATLAQFGLPRVAVSFLGPFLLPWVLDTGEVAKLDRVTLKDFAGAREHYYDWKVDLYDRLGRVDKRTVYADSLLHEIELDLKATPNDFNDIAYRAWTLALLGRDAEAVSEVTRAVAMMPLTKDYDWGCTVLQNEAQVLTYAGHQEEAITKLSYLLSVPCGVTVPGLRINPVWDSLRGNRRFKKLVA